MSDLEGPIPALYQRIKVRYQADWVDFDENFPPSPTRVYLVRGDGRLTKATLVASRGSWVWKSTKTGRHYPTHNTRYLMDKSFITAPAEIWDWFGGPPKDVFKRP